MDPIAAVAIKLAVILVAAKVGGDLAVRIGQPAVLGELVIGVLLGNASLVGVDAFHAMAADPAIAMLAGLGVLILLFEVGLKATVAQMMQVGWSAFMVALLGVVAPFALGWAVGAWLLPSASVSVHVFLGATLTATSVGITARVLQDLKREHSVEARLILGAAVIDDVMGLVILAVVTGLIAAAAGGRPLGAGPILWVMVKASLFFLLAIAIGVRLAPRLLRAAGVLKAPSVLVAVGLATCFALSWLADLVGLAPIVGAFAAGLIFERTQYAPFVERGEPGLEELVHPIAGFLVPVFFVLMGLRTDLASFAGPGVLGLAAALTLVAIAGKLACGFGVLQRGVDRVSVAVGMIPRGEVGLIFANVGLGLVVAGERIVSVATYSSIVIVVIVTTLITPPLLKATFERQGRG